MQGHEPLEAPREEGANWKAWTLGIAGVLLLILIFQNLQEVRIDFLFVHTSIPLIFALLLTGALGALIGWAAPHIRRGRRE